MHLPGIDAESRGPLHRLAPGLKLAGTLAIILFTVLLPRRPDPLYAYPAAVVVALCALSRMPLRHLLRRLLIAETFVIGIAILSLLAPASAPLFLATILKSNICVLAMLVLTSTTPFHEILRVLRRIHFPAVMVTTLALMYRYVPVLAEETRRMQRARTSRTFCRKRGIEWRNLTQIIGQLFIRTADRAERIYLAMCARGWR